MSVVSKSVSKISPAYHGFACRLLDLLGQDVRFQAVHADREASMLTFIA